MSSMVREEQVDVLGASIVRYISIAIGYGSGTDNHGLTAQQILTFVIKCISATTMDIVTVHASHSRVIHVVCART